MSEPTSTIRVNFGKPFPVFPLEGVVLLPHALARLFIFEPRYRQMVKHALDGAGQIAMGVFAGDEWKSNYLGNPPIRPAVCLGQIVHHECLPDGCYRIVLQGVCRARIVEERDPEGDRLYRTAVLRPVETGDREEPDMDSARRELLSLMDAAPLADLSACRAFAREAGTREIPTCAMLELLTLTVLNDRSVQYRLLAEGDPRSRARLIIDELRSMRRALERAAPQFDPDAPSGCTWN